MPIRINSPGWQRAGATRGAAAARQLPGLPAEFLTPESRVAEEDLLEPVPPSRGAVPVPAAAPQLDVSYDLGPGQAAVLVIRHASGALTFHQPIETTSRGARGPGVVRFQVALRPAGATRGFGAQLVKAILVKAVKVGADNVASFVLPKLAAAIERSLFERRGLREGWLKVSVETLAARRLEPGTPVSPERSLLLIHGAFSDTAGAYGTLAASNFFARIKDTYGDRVFGFDHFSVSRTPEENARMLLETLPEQTTTFDVITHSRGGLVLRSIVERAAQFEGLARRFALGRAVLVASPNEGTPLATPRRWDETFGWIANLLELFPDNPFTSGAAFVGNSLVWLANHASGDLPGLHSMDSDGAMISEIQAPPGPPSGTIYSALVSNYHPEGDVLARLLDAGIDRFFATANDLVVPSEGGWRVDHLPTPVIPSTRIGCFGAGGNVAGGRVTHIGFFSHPETVDFLVNGLLNRPQQLRALAPLTTLPVRRLVRDLPSPPVPGVAATARALPATAEAARAAATTRPEALEITVINGDLTFEREVLLIGHYRASKLTGTERVMDNLIGGGLSRSLAMGVYPLAIGSHQAFINTRSDLARGSFLPRPKAVIVAGLGDEGKLRGPDLVKTVRTAVIAWSQRLAEGERELSDSPRRRVSERSSDRAAKHRTGRETFELAATLIGSGGTGVSAGEASRLIAQGVYEANAAIAEKNCLVPGDLNPDEYRPLPSVGRLRLVELYLDRATDALRALRLQDEATPGRYRIPDAVDTRDSALTRPVESSYRGAEFDFVTVETRREADGSASIAYTLDTRRARTEVRGQRTQSALVSDLVATVSNDRNRDQQVGRTLFNLLIPIELEPYLAGSAETQFDLDPQNAAIPWELLETAPAGQSERPWAIRVKLLRKLRIEQFRDEVADAGPDADVLIIGEPECPPEYPRLYGAQREAIAARDCLSRAGLRPTAIISDSPAEAGPNARAVLNAVFERPWRVVHIAGHGVAGTGGKPGGVVLSNGTFLGPDEIENMRKVPELVFVNCCHLGAADSGQLLQTFNRAEFASGVAGALIKIGVRCVVAAGWAVDDDAATTFAAHFYESLVRGARFIDAVADARLAAYEQRPEVNTWGAYQCYGDPDWRLAHKGDGDRVGTPPVEDFSAVASATALKLVLRRIIVHTRFQGAEPATQRESLERLAARATRPEHNWAAEGDVADLFGEAFVEADAVEMGISWYERAVSAADGRASMRAAEQLANARARLGWEIVDKAARHRQAMGGHEVARKLSPGERAAARSAYRDADQRLRQAIDRARDLSNRAESLLDQLMALEPTMERANLIGSVHHRRALVDTAAGRPAAVRQSLLKMKDAYERAQAIGESNGATNVYYSAFKRLVAEVALGAGNRRWSGVEPPLVALIRKHLKMEEGFWSVVGRTELAQYQALAGRALAEAAPRLRLSYDDLYRRVKATRLWASVYDTASLVLPSYAARAAGAERTAAGNLLAQVRRFAHPAAHSQPPV